MSGKHKYIVDILGDLPVILMELNNSGDIVKTYIYANSHSNAVKDYGIIEILFSHICYYHISFLDIFKKAIVGEDMGLGIVGMEKKRARNRVFTKTYGRQKQFRKYN